MNMRASQANPSVRCLAALDGRWPSGGASPGETPSGPRPSPGCRLGVREVGGDGRFGCFATGAVLREAGPPPSRGHISSRVSARREGPAGFPTGPSGSQAVISFLVAIGAREAAVEDVRASCLATALEQSAAAVLVVPAFLRLGGGEVQSH